MLNIDLRFLLTVELYSEFQTILSGKISTEDGLMKFGIDGLKLTYNKIKSTLTNHPRNIQSAVHDVLHAWLVSQSNRSEAMKNITVALESCEMNQLLGELRQHTDGEPLAAGVSSDSTYQRVWSENRMQRYFVFH